jgi:3-isopropylmalate dehydratase small subunit
MQSFLGIVNYSRIFIENLSEIALPITKLTRKSSYWKWNENTQFTFDYLKLKLTTAPTLKYANPELQYVLQTDASNFALGAVLLQNSHPIAYFSKKLIDAEIIIKFMTKSC